MREGPAGRVWPMAAAAVLLGVVAGFASLALGPVGLVLAALLTVLTVNRLRRRLIGLGVYFASLGATGSLILAPVVIGSQACPAPPSVSICYAPSTLPALVAFVVIGAAGLGVIAYAIVRRTRPRAPAKASANLSKSRR